MQPVNALGRLKERVIAHLKSINILHFRFGFAQKTQRQPDLSIGNRRGKTGFLSNPMPLQQVLFATIDNDNLPDEQHLRGVLQVRLIRAMQIT